MLRGWCAYFQPGVSSVTFSYLSHYAWQTVWRWLRRKHRAPPSLNSAGVLRRRMVADHPARADVRSREGGHDPLPLPRLGHPIALAVHRTRNHPPPERGLWRARCIERCTPGSGSGSGKRIRREADTAPRADFHRPPTPVLVAFISEHRQEFGVEPICTRAV